MKAGNFKSLLSQLGYADTLLAKAHGENEFSYSITAENSAQELHVDYFYFHKKQDLFDKHLSVWNQNNRPSFVAIFDDQTYIIDSRQKPDVDSPLSRRVVIKSFDYGVNTAGFDIADELSLISKEGIDSSYYFRFVVDHQQRKKASEVDKDLLLNLLELRNDLVNKQNENTIHLLLLRCLFVKYLEDRGVFDKNYLHDALSQQSPEKLIAAFRKVRKINGDLFKQNELTADDLIPKYLQKLALFFGHFDYRTKQGTLFPYQFDKIPIQLISNIYESFLKEETKKGNGVYYTPSFLVNFMLSQTLSEKLKQTLKAKILDPACGSGAFLVEAFRLLIKASKAEKNYEKKKQILQHQLFGIDLDSRALQIAAFSLYLALLEGEKPEFIQEKIRTESPILPGLIGKTLIHGNALTDDIEFKVNDKKLALTFDCIVANPPWGSAKDDDDNENVKVRTAVGNKSKAGTIEEYRHVSDFQKSQAFLMRTKKWCHYGTIASMVVNNSIFLNENAASFRRSFLENYRLCTFFELSNINTILFKKRKIGEVKSKTVEIGANEPCCVLVYNTLNSPSTEVRYISPKLNSFTESLRLIAFGSHDVKTAKQSDFINEDLLWRIFVNGGWADYQIIKKRIINSDKSISIQCRSGFQPQVNMHSIGKPEYKDLIHPSSFLRYGYPDPNKIKQFNWSQTLRRKPTDDVFSSLRLLIPVRPLQSDELRFRTILMSDEAIHTDNILSIKLKSNGEYITNYLPILAIFNSKFIGYYLYLISSQWGKGDAKRSTLRNSEVENLPMPLLNYSDKRVKKLEGLVEQIIDLDKNSDEFDLIEKGIDNLVFDLYGLTIHERSVVNEFHEIHSSKKNALVNSKDLNHYGNRFASVFKQMLSDDVHLSFSHTISPNLGALICFQLNPKGDEEGGEKDILSIVKKAQTERSYFSSVLSEEKVKYYDKKAGCFYIIKSNLYKDWTERKAFDDANEEIAQIITYLRKK
jgi:type I restriction-modification system DNA methylase subunit